MKKFEKKKKEKKKQKDAIGGDENMYSLTTVIMSIIGGVIIGVLLSIAIYIIFSWRAAEILMKKTKHSREEILDYADEVTSAMSEATNGIVHVEIKKDNNNDNN